MQKYHYTDGTNSFGPFTIEELRFKGITPDTYVWAEGMPNWVLAKDVPLLASLFTSNENQAGDQPYYTNPYPSTPQIPNPAGNGYRVNNGNPPKTYLIESILSTILCCWPLGIPSIVYAARVEKKFYAGDILGAEQDSANAKKWILINIGATVGLWILYFIIFGFAFFAGLSGY